MERAEEEASTVYGYSNPLQQQGLMFKGMSGLIKWVIVMDRPCHSSSG
jgi:hypothetical protein